MVPAVPDQSGQASKAELVEAVADALLILGRGSCADPSCQGCQYERQETVAVLQAIYGKYYGHVCSICHGERFVAATADDDVDYVSCQHCQGNGVEPDFDIYVDLIAARPDNDK